MHNNKIDYDFGKFPSGWPRPTNMGIDENGSLDIEWIFGNHDDPDKWRVLFTWIPNEGAMICKTTSDGQESYESESLFADPDFIGKILNEWLSGEINEK